MNGIGRDVAYAMRLLWRSPGFTLAAVLTLALGIGANTAIFSLADATLLRPFRVADPSQLVVFKWTSALSRLPASRRSARISSPASPASRPRVNATVDGTPELIDAAFVSGNYFGVMGVPAAAGRVLGARTIVPERPARRRRSTTRGGADGCAATRRRSARRSVSTDRRSRSSASRARDFAAPACERRRRSTCP